MNRLTPMENIQVWQPRYKDRTVLIARYKVGTHNRITFTKAKHLEGKEFYMSGEDIRNYPLDTNGKIDCYAVSLDDLERINNG